MVSVLLNGLGDNDNDLKLLLWLMLMEKYLIWSLKISMIKREDGLAKVKTDFDQNRKSQSKLSIGTLVVLQNKCDAYRKTGRWKRKGIIMEKKQNRYLTRSRLILKPVKI